ncbi:MAG: hypothetical protein U9P38_05665 [Campylobacterota bacterium]|nr:hypothetical protein [Campylobacterota bacterium]
MNDFIERYSFQNYFVNDLLYDDTEIVFVLESPHVYEVKNGYPVAGKSGKDMSKVLVQDEALKNDSFGKLVYEQKIQKFGIVNISNIPLQELAYSTEDSNFSKLPTQLIFKDFVLFRQNPSLRKKDCRVNKLIKIFQEDFAKRLSPHRDKKIVLCGGFVHKIFNDTFSHEEFRATIEVPHPSFNNWSKLKYKEKIEQLKEFIKDENSRDI